MGIGRDFTDVPPSKGLLRGWAEQSISVRVETRVLVSLPSVVWEDQFPPLQTALMDIVSQRPAERMEEDDVSQKQQQ